MKIGASSVGYTSGTLYKRQKSSVGYAPGSKFDRFGNFGLIRSRNRAPMNRNAVANYVSSFAFAGTGAFEAKQIESEGLSEIAAEKLVKRVQDELKALAAKRQQTIANLGVLGGAATTGSNVNQTA
jgi:hypothetical protein